jgi:hypothetical protein
LSWRWFSISHGIDTFGRFCMGKTSKWVWVYRRPTWVESSRCLTKQAPWNMFSMKKFPPRSEVIRLRSSFFHRSGGKPLILIQTITGSEPPSNFLKSYDSATNLIPSKIIYPWERTSFFHASFGGFTKNFFLRKSSSNSWSPG